jgi:hypothetical protein
MNEPTEFTEETLRRRIHECAAAMPGPFKPDSASWGASAGSDLLTAVRGTPLWGAWRRTLEEFFASGNEDQIAFADEFCSPDLDPRVVRAALGREDLSPETRALVRGSLGRLLTAQPDFYDPSLRAEFGQPGARPLLGAMMIADHAWLMETLGPLLAREPDAADLLWFAVMALGREKLAVIRAEILALQLGVTVESSLLEVIDYFAGGHS